MKYTFLLSIITLALFSCSTSKNVQNRFEGKLVYEIFYGDKSFQPKDSSKYQVIYAKDSLVRVDNFTQLGKQMYLQHIPKNRAYTLVDLYGEKYAIQSIPDSIDQIASKYTFDYKRGKKKIAGKDANKVLVTIEGTDAPIEMYYYKDISHDYSNAIPGLKGLPVDYTIYVKGDKIRYKLVSFTEQIISKDYFGIPTDYKIMSATEFMGLITSDTEE